MAHTGFFAPAPSKRRVGVVRTLRLASLIDLWRSRRALARLDAAALQDVGLTAEEARKEAAKQLWDVPNNWLR